MEGNRVRRRLTSAQMIIVGFLLGILTGTVLLMLPFSTVGNGGASLEEASFTTVSAICVTGLVLQDTSTYWSFFGQAVILMLIQVGGMGVMTAVVAISMLWGRKIGLMQRSTLQEAISAVQVGGIVRLTGFILRTMLVIEGLGALCLMPSFCLRFGFWKGLWYALFHSISAFCNAGFDLMGEEAPFMSLTGYVGNPFVTIPIMLLIISGGIGFLTWEDIRRNGLRLKRYRMQSKVILAVTLILLAFPALYFYFYEFGMENWQGMSGNERLLASLFQAVTPRTAGFNTVDLSRLSEPGQFLIMLLMLVGGSPGSTAGGFKTTTLAVLVLTAIAVFCQREAPECFGRRLSVEAVRNAAAILCLYGILFLGGGLLICCLDGVPLLAALFEAASAVGTVGLTLGITPDLSLASHMILMLLMFWGRVGGLTLVFAVMSGRNMVKSSFPQEKIMIG